MASRSLGLCALVLTCILALQASPLVAQCPTTDLPCPTMDPWCEHCAGTYDRPIIQWYDVFHSRQTDPDKVEILWNHRGRLGFFSVLVDADYCYGAPLCPPHQVDFYLDVFLQGPIPPDPPFINGFPGGCENEAVLGLNDPGSVEFRLRYVWVDGNGDPIDWSGWWAYQQYFCAPCWHIYGWEADLVTGGLYDEVQNHNDASTCYSVPYFPLNCICDGSDPTACCVEADPQCGCEPVGGGAPKGKGKGGDPPPDPE